MADSKWNVFDRKAVKFIECKVSVWFRLSNSKTHCGITALIQSWWTGQSAILCCVQSQNTVLPYDVSFEWRSLLGNAALLHDLLDHEGMLVPLFYKTLLHWIPGWKTQKELGGGEYQALWFERRGRNGGRSLPLVRGSAGVFDILIANI